MQVEDVVRKISELGIQMITGVPDSILKSLCDFSQTLYYFGMTADSSKIKSNFAFFDKVFHLATATVKPDDLIILYSSFAIQGMVSKI